jgi:hypothetical protein
VDNNNILKLYDVKFVSQSNLHKMLNNSQNIIKNTYKKIINFCKEINDNNFSFNYYKKIHLFDILFV